MLVLHNRFQHLAPRHPKQIRRHTRYFDIAALAQLLDAVLGPVQVLQYVHSVPCQIPQLADRPWWHPTAPQLAAIQQIGNPLRILGVGLVAVEPLDVLRVHQNQLGELAFQQIP